MATDGTSTADTPDTPATTARAWRRGLPWLERAVIGVMVLAAVVDAAPIPAHWADGRWALLLAADVAALVGASAWMLVRRSHWRSAALIALAASVATSVALAVRGPGAPGVLSLVVTGIALAAGLVLVIPTTTGAGDPVGPFGAVLASLPVAGVLMVGVGVLAGAPGISAVATSALSSAGSRSAAGSTTDMRAMPSMRTGAGPSAGGSMPSMAGTSAMPPSTAMSSMPSGTVPGGSGAMPAMSAMGAPAGSSGPAGPSGWMPGMGGGTPGGSGGGALSLPTTSPAGPITWPLSMGTMGPGMQMVTPDCTAAPTASQQQAAVTLVDQTVAAVGRYQSLANAKADGYVPITPTGLPVVHYAKPSLINDGTLLDPDAIESLVYANTPHGAVLVAAMYLMASNQVGATPPMPGGCLTEWHLHTNLCFSDTNGTVVGITKEGTCPAGSANHVSQPMIHVWLAPLPGGPLVVDASDAQVVQAAEQLPLPSPLNPTA